MKKMLFFIPIILMFSCKTNNSFQKELANTDGEIPFTLNCKDYKDRPVISLEDSGSIFYFMVDTGTTYSHLNENGLKKCNFDLNENISYENITVTFNIEDKRFLPSDKKIKISMPIEKETEKEKYVDGMLGIDFFTMYDNVVFDYKEKKLKFNQSPINENFVKMYKSSANTYYIFYYVNGIEDFGLLDTGAMVFVVRETYKTPYADFSEDEIKKMIEQSEVLNEKVSHINFENINIGHTEYNNMKGYLARDKRLKAEDNAKKSCRFKSSLGTPFYKNHIIQLDFKNNKFYIE